MGWLHGGSRTRSLRIEGSFGPNLSSISLRSIAATSCSAVPINPIEEIYTLATLRCRHTASFWGFVRLTMRRGLTRPSSRISPMPTNIPESSYNLTQPSVGALGTMTPCPCHMKYNKRSLRDNWGYPDNIASMGNNNLSRSDTS